MREIPTDLPVRAVTVQQPWAWAIIHGDPPKDIENRTWKPTRPFLMLVHAGKRTDFDGFKFIRRQGIEPPLTSQLPYGAIVGAVTVASWTQHSTSRWAIPGQWHWLLENPFAFDEPLACRGLPGLFAPPAGWRERIR
jgi:hypothetical protein